MKLIKRLGHLLFEERLRAGTVQSGEEKAQGDFSSVCKHLLRGSKGQRARLSSEVPSEKTRGNRQKLKYEKFHMKEQRNVFTQSYQTLEQVASLNPCRYSNPSWIQPSATCSSCYCFEQGFELGDHHRCLPASTIL